MQVIGTYDGRFTELELVPESEQDREITDQVRAIKGLHISYSDPDHRIAVRTIYTVEASMADGTTMTIPVNAKFKVAS